MVKVESQSFFDGYICFKYLPELNIPVYIIDSYALGAEKIRDISLPTKYIDIDHLIVCIGLHEWSVCETVEVAENLLGILFSSFKEAHPNLEKISVFYPPSVASLLLPKSEYQTEKFSFDWWLVRLFNPTGISESFTWSGGNGKGIAMFGDSANRIQKIGFVDYLDSVNKLHLLNYSMTHKINYPELSSSEYAEELYDNPGILCNAFLSDDLTKQEAKEKYLKYYKEFEQDDILTIEEGKLFDKTSVFFPKEFQQASLNFVVETSTTMEWGSLTEKSFKAFLAGMPFIHMHPFDYGYKYLKDLGFKTFENYTDFPILDNDQSENTYLTKNYMMRMMDLAINRLESFIINIPKYKQNIIEDCEYNKKHLLSIQSAEYNKLITASPELQKLDRKFVLDLICNH